MEVLILDNYKRIEKMLYGYKADKLRILNINRELEKSEVTGISGVSYDGIGGGSGEINDTVANEVHYKIEREKNLLEEKELKEKNIKIIDETLEILPSTQRQIIIEFYIENKQWWQVAGIVKYSEQHCRKMRRQAIKTIESAVYG